MYIKRIADKLLRSLVDEEKVGIILGARQVGKTTLVEHVLAERNALFLNFDLEFDKQRFLAAAALPPESALSSFGNPEVLVLDEAQRLPEASRIVKGWYDKGLPVKILLLGSSPLNLLNQSAEALTGRNSKLFLPPLLFEEALTSQSWVRPEYTPEIITTQFGGPLRSCLMEAMVYGSYPEVTLTNDKERLLQNLSSDYLWKDVLQTGLVKAPNLIRKLLLLLAHQTGSEVSVNELATQLHTARPTVERYLDLLEQTFVIFRLPAFSTNPRKEIAKSKKIYFWDTGIRNALLQAFSCSEFRPDIGALWENWAMAEVAKRNLLEGTPHELYFWRTRSQSEVDLILKSGENLRAIEFKWRTGRASPGRAFRDAYGVDVEMQHAEEPLFSKALFE